MRKVRVWSEQEGTWCTQDPKITETEDVGGTLNPCTLNPCFLEVCPPSLTSHLHQKTDLPVCKRPLGLVGCRCFLQEEGM